MTPLRRRLLLNAAKLFDLEVMVSAFGLATVLVAYETPATSLAQFFALRIKVQNFAQFACLLLAWHTIFIAFGLYGSQRLSTRLAEVLDPVKATTVASLTLFLAAALLRIRLVSPQFVLVFWAASSAAVAGSRLLARYLLQGVRRQGRNLRHVLIVGTNPRAVRFARKIEARPELGYRIAGFLDDDWQGLGEFRKTGYPLVCDLAGFPGYLRNQVADEVVVALPMESSYARASRIAGWCEEQGVVVSVLSDIFNMRMARPKAEEFGYGAVITLNTGGPESWQQLCKRTLDVAIALAALLALAPLLALTAALIKLASAGPAFFIQERVGLNKRKFRLLKFRTMVVGAENQFGHLQHLNEVSGPVFKIRNDPRVTGIGRFLRQMSIDELPQLFNVLMGDMSLVGPRPLPWRDYNGFEQDWQRRRFSVRPGITCLWQIQGRSSIPFEKWMELDMQYIDEWSLWLDFKILAKTVPAVLKGTGAA
jgi:exopolysaccharide biosynthesis polyprenyl glycosylphosphotransferase